MQKTHSEGTLVSVKLTPCPRLEAKRDLPSFDCSLASRLFRCQGEERGHIRSPTNKQETQLPGDHAKAPLPKLCHSRCVPRSSSFSAVFVQRHASPAGVRELAAKMWTRTDKLGAETGGWGLCIKSQALRA